MNDPEQRPNATESAFDCCKSPRLRGHNEVTDTSPTDDHSSKLKNRSFVVIGSEVVDVLPK